MTGTIGSSVGGSFKDDMIPSLHSNQACQPVHPGPARTPRPSSSAQAQGKPSHDRFYATVSGIKAGSRISHHLSLQYLKLSVHLFIQNRGLPGRDIPGRGPLHHSQCGPLEERGPPPLCHQQEQV